MSMYSLNRDRKMIRHFYPIGHGAFYVEEFDSFYIVYDCGTIDWKEGFSTTIVNKRIKPIIENEMDKNKPILALFISHFHDDHVNGIDLLWKHCKIKNIFFPFYDKKEIVELEYLISLSSSEAASEYFNSIIYKIINSSSENTIDGTNLYAVDPVNYDENNRPEETSEETIELNDDNESPRYQKIHSGPEYHKIHSGIKINIKFKDWVYIPYNFDFTQGQKDFIKNAKEKFEIEEYKTDKEVLQIIKDKLITEFDDAMEILKKCFGKYGPEINRKSLVVYSGPLASSKDCYYQDIYHNSYLANICYIDKIYNHYLVNKLKRFYPGCLYLGDCNVKNGNYKILIEKYQDYIKHIGIVQIPHHGSIENSDNQLIEDKFKNKVLFIVSASSSDKKHPAISMIESLLINHCNFKIITEIKDSFVVACICQEEKNIGY